MLRILLLGPPIILFDDRPLKIQRRQLRNMLLFLASLPDGIGRGEILTKFWPEKSETVGRRHLREVLSKLRMQLPDPEIIKTDMDMVWLDKKLVYSDVFEYQRLVQSTQHALWKFQINTPLPDNHTSRLELAVGLWRSTEFWSGRSSGVNSEFDNWLQDTGAALKLNLVQNLERLSNHFSALGEYEQAIYYTQNALKTDEHNEELQEQLLSLLYKTGRISEARTFYSYLTELYKREFNDDPPEFIQHTVTQAAQFTFEEPKNLVFQWNLEKNEYQHFVGRKDEIQQLRKYFQHGDIVFIIGEAGAGKTRLVQQFYNTLEKKPRLLLATCHALESDLPLQPIIDMIRNNIHEDDWINLDQQWIQALSILVPEIAHNPKLSPDSMSALPGQARSILFEAIRQLLMVVARSSRILLVLDDAQWSDKRTLEVLMYLVERNFFLEYGLCIVNSRPEIQNSEIQELFLANQHHITIATINLDFLDQEEVAELVRYSLGETPTDAFLQRINNATGGNPLFIIETIDSLLSATTDLTSIQEQSSFPISNSIASIVNEKEANVSEEARKILSAAAICGMEFQMDVLELMEGLHADTLVRCLEELEDNRFIQPILKSVTPGRYTFIHNMIREAIVSRISYARRCLLHNQIATAMAASQSHASNQYASIIAHHFEEAGRPLPAFRNWIRAGQYARSLYATSEAYAAFRHCDAIRSRLESALSEDDLYLLYSEWGDLAYTIMDMNTLNECYSAMHAAGEQKNSPLLIGSALSGLAIPAALSLDIGRSLVLLEQSITILAETNHTFEKIQALSRMGIGLYLALQHQKAVEMYLQAIELGKDISTPAIRKAVATVQYQLSILYSLMGYPILALQAGNDALKNVYLLVSNPDTESQVYLALTLASYFLGDFKGANENYHKCIQIAEPMQNYRAATLAYLIKARMELAAGKLGRVWDLAQTALKISTENGFFDLTTESHCIMGDYYNILEDYPNAIIEYQRGVESMLESNHGMNCYFRLGYVTAKNGDVNRGLEILEQAINFAKSVDLLPIYYAGLAYQAVVYQDIGKHVEARIILDQVMHECSELGLKTVQYQIDHANGKFSINPGDIDDIESTISRLKQSSADFNGLWIKALAHEIRVRLSQIANQNNQQMDSILNFIDDIDKKTLIQTTSTT